MASAPRPAIRAALIACLVGMSACGGTSKPSVATNSAGIESAPALPRVSSTPTGRPAGSVPVPPCRNRQVRARYFGTEAGAGSDFGGFVVWDPSVAPCRLARTGTITPIMRRGPGRELRIRLETGRVLSARSAPPTGDHRPHSVEASFTISGEYRDGPGPRGLCDRHHEVVPRYWRFRDGKVHRLIRNGPSEPRRDLPDGAHPYGSGGTQPVEGCGSRFLLAHAGRSG